MDNYYYVDVTKRFLNKVNMSDTHIEEICKYKNFNRINTSFDLKDISDLERKTAKIIQKRLGGKIKLIHRVQTEGISTPDVIYYNKHFSKSFLYFDIKSPKKSISLNNKHKKISRQLDAIKRQTENIIISLLREECDLTNFEAKNQLIECLKREKYCWINNAILVGKNNYIKVYQKKKRP